MKSVKKNVNALLVAEPATLKVVSLKLMKALLSLRLESLSNHNLSNSTIRSNKEVQLV